MIFSQISINIKYLNNFKESQTSSAYNLLFPHAIFKFGLKTYWIYISNKMDVDIEDPDIEDPIIEAPDAV